MIRNASFGMPFFGNATERPTEGVVVLHASQDGTFTYETVAPPPPASEAASQPSGLIIVRAGQPPAQSPPVSAADAANSAGQASRFVAGLFEKHEICFASKPTPTQSGQTEGERKAREAASRPQQRPGSR
ncbi:MAG: hypothetical protein AB7P76_00765 [Candidatus Melainabacteria bacterium]